MKIDVLTLFPEMFDTLNASLMGRAREKGLYSLTCHNIRDFSADKHKKCDDTPYGGGAGMVMTPQPIHDCIAAVDPCHNSLRIYMSPRGQRLTQQKVAQLSKCDSLLILCGHYEGVDQRVIDLDVDEEISVGDYVLSGGELPAMTLIDAVLRYVPAMTLIDAVLRYVPDVLGNGQSTVDESFSGNLLEYPQYTRPQEFCGLQVPEVLVSGNHQNVEKWRREQSLAITRKVRPDLLEDK